MLKCWLSLYGTIGIPSLIPFNVGNTFFSVTQDGVSFSQNIIDMGKRKIKNTEKGTENTDVATIGNVEEKEKIIDTKINNESKRIDTKLANEITRLTSQHMKKVEKKIIGIISSVLTTIEPRLQPTTTGKTITLPMLIPPNISSDRSMILNTFDDKIDTTTLLTLSNPNSSFRLSKPGESPSNGIIIHFAFGKQFDFDFEYIGLERIYSPDNPAVGPYVGDFVLFELRTIASAPHVSQLIVTRRFVPQIGDHIRTFRLGKTLPVGDDWLRIKVTVFCKKVTTFKLIVREL